MTAVSRLAEEVVYAYDRSDPADPRIVASYPVPGDVQDHTVAADLSICVYATGDRVICVDQSGDLRWSLDLGTRGERAGLARTAVALSRDDTAVWVYAPDLMADRGSADRWLSVAAATGAPLTSRDLDCQGHGGAIFTHPSGEMLLDVGEGQDGTRIYRSDGGGFGWTDRSLVAVSPDGGQFMTVHHEQQDVAFHCWPSGATIARTTLTPMLEWTGGYLTADVAVAVVADHDQEQWRHVTLDTRTGAVLGDLTVTTVDPYDLQPMGDGTYLTTDTDGRLRAHPHL